MAPEAHGAQVLPDPDFGRPLYYTERIGKSVV